MYVCMCVFVCLFVCLFVCVCLPTGHFLGSVVRMKLQETSDFFRRMHVLVFVACVVVCACVCFTYARVHKRLDQRCVYASVRISM